MSVCIHMLHSVGWGWPVKLNEPSFYTTARKKSVVFLATRHFYTGCRSEAQLAIIGLFIFLDSSPCLKKYISCKDFWKYTLYSHDSPLWNFNLHINVSQYCNWFWKMFQSLHADVEIEKNNNETVFRSKMATILLVSFGFHKTRGLVKIRVGTCSFVNCILI